MFSMQRLEVLVFRFRFDEGILCPTEALKIVTTSEHVTQMFLVGDMIAEAIDHCPSQERMIACWQLLFRTLTLIRFSLEFLGVFRHIELNSTVSDFLDCRKSHKTKQTLFTFSFIIISIELAHLVSFEGPLLVHS